MKQYSVWVRIDNLRFKNLSEAIKSVKDSANQMNDGMLTRFNGKCKIQVLDELTKDINKK